MLNKIKSTYILKIIFSYQLEKNKFKLIKYIKSLKNKLDINLIDYRRFSGKYIIQEKEKGKIKEYDSINDQLIFEGEYSNGKREGKGKEYYYDEKISDEFQSIFEGEYLNGKRNGKGKEYYWDGKLKFEGEYLYGYRLKGKYYLRDYLEYEGEYLYNKKWNGKGFDEYNNIAYELINGNGKVKEYNYEGILLFEGEYLNGLKNGKGKEYDFSGRKIFEGEYLNGVKNGKGKEYDYYNKKIFEGDYLNGKKIGTWECSDLI